MSKESVTDKKNNQTVFSLKPIVRQLAVVGALSLNILSADVLAFGSCTGGGNNFTCSGGPAFDLVEVGDPMVTTLLSIKLEPDFSAQDGLHITNGGNITYTDSGNELSTSAGSALTIQTINTPSNVTATVSGQVTGGTQQNNFGILSSGAAGIHTWNINGKVQGTSAAMFVEPNGGTSIININDGAIVQNTSGLSSAPALTSNHTFITGISASKKVNIQAGGQMVGSVNLKAQDKIEIVIDNQGTWNTAGSVNNFTLNNIPSNDGTHINNSGLINAAGATFTGLTSFTNSGTLSLTNNQTGNTTISGEYIGQGGTIEIDTVLGGDNPTADKLILQDTSGTSSVLVHNQGGQGAQTQKGIQIIQVNGTSGATFTLAQRVRVNGFEYKLFKGSAKQTDDGSWYLRSGPDGGGGGNDPDDPNDTDLNDSNRSYPEIGAYLGNQVVAQAMFMHQSHTRVGQTPNSAGNYRVSSTPLGWARIQAGRIESQGAQGTFSNKANTTVLLFGQDFARGSINGQDRWAVGVIAGTGYGKTSAHAKGNDVEATGKVTGYNLGIYGTWFANAQQNEGMYIDGWLQHGWYKNKVSAPLAADTKYNARNLAASIEMGYAVAVGQNQSHQFIIEPQAQLIYMHYRGNDIHEETDTTFNHKNGGHAVTRVGARISAQPLLAQSTLQPFAELNWWNGSGAKTITLNNTDISSDIPNNRVELKAGLEGSIAKNWQLWGQIGGTWGKNSYQSYQGTLGVKYNWK